MPAHVGFALLALLGLRALDPLNMSRLITREAETRLSRVQGAWHPGGLCWRDCPPAAGRDAVSVVLIDDQTREALGAWPPSFAWYGAAVDAVANRHPRVIFLDLTIGERRTETADPLVAAIRRARAGGTAVLIGQIGRDGVLPRITCPDGSARRGGNTAPRLACEADAAVPIRWENEAGLIWYPLNIELSGGETVPSPATAMAGYLRPGPAADDLTRSHDDILLAWPRGGTADENGCRTSEPPRPGLIGRAWAASQALFQEPTWPADTCPYVPSVSMQELLDAEETGPDPLIEHRAVIVGVSFFGSQDMKQPPVGPELSGAFYHATALENLLSFGFTDAPRYEPFEPGLNLSDVALTVLLVAGISFPAKVAAGLGLRHEAPASGDSRRWSGWRLRVVAALATLLLAVLVFRFIAPMPAANFEATLVVVLVIEIGSALIERVHEFFIEPEAEHHS